MNEMYSVRKVRTTLTVQTSGEPDTLETGDGLLVCGRYVINFIEEPVQHVSVHELRACQFTSGDHIIYDYIGDVRRQLIAEKGLDLSADELRNMSAIAFLIHLTINQKEII